MQKISRCCSCQESGKEKQDKTVSAASVSRSRRSPRILHYCFGCKAGGTVISFIMEMERLSFPEAVRYLADQLHMPLPQMEDDPDYQRRRTQRERLLNANREAAQFFHKLLFSPRAHRFMPTFKSVGSAMGSYASLAWGLPLRNGICSPKP